MTRTAPTEHVELPALGSLDWSGVAAQLDTEGFATTGPLLSPGSAGT